MPFIREPDGWYFVQDDYRIGPEPHKDRLRAQLRLDPPPEPKPAKPRRVVKEDEDE